MMRIAVLCMILLLFFSLPVSAAQLDVFDKDIAVLEEQVPDDTEEDMDALAIGRVDDVIAHGIDASALAAYIGQLLSRYSATPLAGLLLMISVIILASVGEAYTHSLRYTDTQEVMNVVSSLYIAVAAVQPVSSLIGESVDVLQAASRLMTAYLPLMAGIAAFTGRIVSSAGYYAAVVSVSQLISRLSVSVLAPLLKLFLSLSVSSGICPRLKMNGILEMIGKLLKWLLTFSMTVFTSVLGLNGVLSAAGESLAGKAAKFTLSSSIPLIGSSIAEAYQTVRGSVNLLRSGIGVFVIAAVFVAFAPLLIQVVLWSLTFAVARIVQDAFSVTSTSYILSALSSFTAVLRAIIIAVLTAFVISSAVMFRIGGAA